MTFNINNRRYTGCKNKLCPWIRDIIVRECKNAKSFCDLFAGTGVVTSYLINDYRTFILNDFLYSNEIIYKGYFSKGSYSEKKLYKFYNDFNNIDQKKIRDNYFSQNYANKFFSKDDAKKIGYIRQKIEDNKDSLNKKEYAILMASLLYSVDRSANTCGHYDAYIKKKNIRSSFRFELIQPIINSSNKNVQIDIYREDVNKLVKTIKADVFYLDPPYSSRQYSRFYHVLETLTKWDKPKLYGTALKPKEENMSEYCKSKAIDVFKDLVYSINGKYIVVSYNNTYNSKSKSSKNKMNLEDILSVLNEVGNTKIFEKKHKAFNAGKTDISNHKEYLFVTKIKG